MVTTFLDDLERYGPQSTVSVSRADALAYCAQLTASHYENFSVVTRLTPREHRPAFASIYAFCRWSDDLGDELDDPARSLELLAWWRDSLHAMYNGQARHPVFIALAETVAKYHIPPQPFEHLISAFEQDQHVHEYEDETQLLDYCTRSANPVGRLVLYTAGAYSEENARLSDHTCTALQLTNFWQDVARDLAIGRIYLPRADRERFGCRESDLRGRLFTPEFAAMMKHLVDRTRAMFEAGRPLITRIPRPLAVDIDLFSRGGLAILDRIERQHYDVLSSRPTLSKLAKLGLLIRAVAGLAHARVLDARPTHQQSHTGEPGS